MNHSDIIRAFGFHFTSNQAPVSLYPFAPVYRLRHAESEWIVKRTQRPLARGQAVAAWAQAASAHGIQLVAAAQGFGENPRAFGTQEGVDEVWVVYPFIAVKAYTGTSIEIKAAGDLLGEIHTTQFPEQFGLKTSETVVAVDASEIEPDVENILQYVHNDFPDFSLEIESMLTDRIQKYFDSSLLRMLKTHLPLNICSWDYKASNLIYVSSNSPILVDIDNAGYIPRLYDLAIAALLFHNEGQGPGRLFTATEWAVFLDGYTRHVRWTEEERQSWEDVLLCAWIDEGLWLVSNDQAGWEDPQQSQLLLSLLRTDLSTFSLAA
jgi:spectinomycin phosphotransferase